jgi:hypothetical protein
MLKGLLLVIGITLIAAFADIIPISRTVLPGSGAVGYDASRQKNPSPARMRSNWARI